MNKGVLYILVAIIMVSLCLTSIPNVFSQSENVKVLSYSWYTSPYYGDFVVVGEIQNTGANIIDFVGLWGIVYTKDGTAQASIYTTAMAWNILPQQKAPFYMDFTPDTTVTRDYSWEALGIENVTFRISIANPTNASQYSDLVVRGAHPSVSSNGTYSVSGIVQNTGNQATNRTLVVATFYNDNGTVVAVGGSDYLNPTSIAPAGITTFSVDAWDSSAVVDQISGYAVLVQAEMTAPPATSPPSSSASPTTTSPAPSPSSPTPTPTSPTPTEPSQMISLPVTYFYGIVAVAIIAVIAAAAFAMWKRR